MSDDRLPAIQALLAVDCPRCGGEGYLGPYGQPEGTCPTCSGTGRIEDEAHDNHLAWCVAEIKKLRARDQLWQQTTGQSDPD